MYNFSRIDSLVGGPRGKAVMFLLVWRSRFRLPLGILFCLCLDCSQFFFFNAQCQANFMGTTAIEYAEKLAFIAFYSTTTLAELEFELIQTQMTQKPMLRAEVYARSLRASQNRKEDGA